MRKTYWLMVAILALSFGLNGCSRSSGEGGSAAIESQGKLSDSDLGDLIKSKLKEDPELAAADLNVSANSDQNSVVLSGTVKSEAMRAKALDLAKNVKPGVSVTDQINVEPSELARTDYPQQGATGEKIGRSVDDAWIHTKIATQLIGNAATQARKIHIDVANGIVTLSGTVATDEERREAGRVAKETEGVKRVIDNLKISSNLQKKQQGPA